MKNLKEVEVEDKVVLVRCDFNVTVKNGEVADDFRIVEAIPTIKDLVKRKAKVVLISHIGRPEKQKSFKKEGSYSALKEVIFRESPNCSLEPVYNELKKHINNISFAKDCVGNGVERKVRRLSSGQVLLLENLRRYEDEIECGKAFSRALASLGDMYVNNAFSVSHRKHASVWGVPRRMPAYPGHLFEREIKVLSRVRDNAESPFIAIIGGAKIGSKIENVEHLMNKADKILLGGKVANAVLTVRGIATNKTLPSEDIIKKLDRIDHASERIHLPIDVLASSKKDISLVREAGPGDVRKEEEIFDIGPETIDYYGDMIKKAQTIVWAGPLGYFEKEQFEIGTKKIAQRIIENDKALKIIGGGDTVYSFKKFGLRDHVDHISSGGGAMLSFLSGQKMPGVDVLNL